MITSEEFANFVSGIKNKDTNFGRVDLDVLHSIVGIAKEAGELLGFVSRIAVYREHFGRNHLKEEAGDVLHYLMMLCNSQGWTLEEVMEANVKKLKKRYPGEEFTYKDAKERKDKIDG